MLQHNFEYDVALSFAGEQRPEVEQVADCLKASGVRVFYDKYEKAKLWGKDLYQHLTDLYQKKARYCIVFASREYAEKAWAGQELRSAQARALTEKGAEYLLPVRFDSTEIPGILPTVGYLDFHVEGPSGICAAVIDKLGVVAVMEATARPDDVSCDYSPKLLLQPAELDVVTYLTVEEGSWAGEIHFVVLAEDRGTDSILSQFRVQSKPFIVAFGFDVAIANLLSATRRTVNGRVSWELRFSCERSDFSNDYEMSVGAVTAEQFAEMRARRLLLNQHPMQEQAPRADLAAFANEAIQESFIRGLKSAVHIKESIFPGLYRTFGRVPKEFLEIGWISAIAYLKLSATVQHVDRLVLTLRGGMLDVEFRGRRHRKYSNAEPHKIEISGSLALQ